MVLVVSSVCILGLKTILTSFFSAPILLIHTGDHNPALHQPKNMNCTMCCSLLLLAWTVRSLNFPRTPGSAFCTCIGRSRLIIGPNPFAVSWRYFRQVATALLCQGNCSRTPSMMFWTFAGSKANAGCLIASLLAVCRQGEIGYCDAKRRRTPKAPHATMKCVAGRRLRMNSVCLAPSTRAQW